MVEVSRPLVSLRGVTRVYPGASPVVALDAVDLTIRRGEFVAIVGASGSGKSSLLNTIGLLDRPTQGTYEFDGRETAELSNEERSRLRGEKIGFIFQAFHLMPHRSVLENVAISGLYAGVSKDTRRRRAAAALEAVGLGHRVGFLPKSISGGEKQRVAIARAIAGRPPLLLCDEPTGNLDSKRSSAIISLFEEMHMDGFTVVVVTHDDDVAARCNRIISVQDGRVKS